MTLQDIFISEFLRRIDQARQTSGEAAPDEGEIARTLMHDVNGAVAAFDQLRQTLAALE